MNPIAWERYTERSISDFLHELNESEMSDEASQWIQAVNIGIPLFNNQGVTSQLPGLVPDLPFIRICLYYLTFSGIRIINCVKTPSSVSAIISPSCTLVMIS